MRIEATNQPLGQLYQDRPQFGIAGADQSRVRLSGATGGGASRRRTEQVAAIKALHDEVKKGNEERRSGGHGAASVGDINER